MVLHDERELVKRLANGDTEAFQEFFYRYTDRIYAHALHFTKSSELAKDLVQDIFTKIWVDREKLAGVEKLEGYLFIVSRNFIKNELRRKVFTVANHDYLEAFFQYDELSISGKLELKELEGHIEQAVNQMPPQLQTAFRLSRQQGLSHEEIAERMKISKFTSKTYIVRALDILRKYMSERFPGQIQ